MSTPPSPGDAPLWECRTTWNAKSLSNCKHPSNKSWITTNPSASSAAWVCIATIATPAPLPPATAKSAGKSPCSVAASVVVWPAV